MGVRHSLCFLHPTENVISRAAWGVGRVPRDISGVEDAPDADKSEVTTHEVPQDDVPGEYYDKDRPYVFRPHS